MELIPAGTQSPPLPALQTYCCGSVIFNTNHYHLPLLFGLARYTRPPKNMECWEKPQIAGNLTAPEALQ